MLQKKSESEVRSVALALPGTPNQKQRRQMLAALGLLLVALILAVVKNREFWFPSSRASEAPPAEQPMRTPAAVAPVPSTIPAPIPVHAHIAKRKIHSKTLEQAATTAPPIAPIVTNRAVLPPLEIEVVAGDQHETVLAKNSALKVDLQPGTPPSAISDEPPAAGSSGVSDASERVRLSPETERAVTQPVQPNYPILAKQMKVQGSVVLQALIGKDGGIQDLRVLTGPAILSGAALEAVRQWRFKPYYQAGVPVETEARITVNFTISTY
jgi:periplasmic protein TonB